MRLCGCLTILKEVYLCGQTLMSDVNDKACYSVSDFIHNASHKHLLTSHILKFLGFGGLIAFLSWL